MFDAKVCGEIKSYVYALIGLDGVPFYVGKGNNNRCFQHIEEAQANLRGTVKLATIRAILNAGKKVRIDIVRHGLDDKTAFEGEAALIDILNLKIEGGNLVAGHGLGREPAEEIQIRYGAQPLITEEPLLLIKINDTYVPGMPLEKVYEMTRWAWRMDIKRAEKCNFVLGVARGIVRGVFKPKAFKAVPENDLRNTKDRGRVYFEGDIVGNSPYFHTSAKVFGQRGQANPIVYLNA